MKNVLMFRNLLLLLVFLAVVPMSSCDDDDDDMSNVITYQNISLTGAKEVPANTSMATGTFNGTFDKTTKVISYTITFTGISPTAMHFHRGDVTESGPVTIGIGSAPYTSPVTGQTPALTQDQEAELLAGKWYVNVHSPQYPAGELRGQVVAQ